ncbi:glutathione S-transferase N-terminal domain-containing protein [Phenylobacterium sp. LjRoot219]|uniref:glutathione S-transferase N-terminal domain-containing protein n=1 Tax=Phenylobacterium sp. LjRoot219 TaxID=3342283 RepID=UPI003F506414
MRLIGNLNSPYVRRVAISLRLMGLPFEHEAVSVFRQFDAFAAINPVVKAPTFVTDEGVNDGLRPDPRTCRTSRHRGPPPDRRRRRPPRRPRASPALQDRRARRAGAAVSLFGEQAEAASSATMAAVILRTVMARRLRRRLR